MSAPEQPVPTQEEADAIKERVMEGNAPPEGTPVANETEATRKERTEREAREQQQRRAAEQRDVKPDTTRAGYTTR
jgi:hypothetical protein